MYKTDFTCYCGDFTSLDDDDDDWELFMVGLGTGAGDDEEKQNDLFMVGQGTDDGDDDEKQKYPDEQVDEQTNRSSSRGEGVEDVEEKKAGMAGAGGQRRTKLLKLHPYHKTAHFHMTLLSFLTITSTESFSHLGYFFKLRLWPNPHNCIAFRSLCIIWVTR